MRHGSRQSIGAPLTGPIAGNALFYHRRGRVGTGTEKCRRRHTFFSGFFFSFDSFFFPLVTSQNFCSLLFNPFIIILSMTSSIIAQVPL